MSPVPDFTQAVRSSTLREALHARSAIGSTARPRFVSLEPDRNVKASTDTYLRLHDGWYVSEEWGCWGKGTSHVLRLRVLDTSPDTDLIFTADTQVCLPDADGTQTVDVSVDGETLTTWQYSAEDNHRLRHVRIPGAMMSPDGDFTDLELLFRPTAAVRPADHYPES